MFKKKYKNDDLYLTHFSGKIYLNEKGRIDGNTQAQVLIILYELRIFRLIILMLNI